jgi:hypothetical protein
VDKLFPIYTLDENKKVLSPNAMRLWVESVDKETIGDEIYLEEPKPCTVETNPATAGELKYPAAPSPCTVETITAPIELKYPAVPSPWTVETITAPTELKYPPVPRPWTVDTRPVELM